MAEIVQRYLAVVRRLDALIATTPESVDTSRQAMRARASERMERLRRFLVHLGRPAERIPKVHIGGTSGKGSTTTALAAILTAAGYRTGVHTSPYLQAPSEKLQCNGELIEAERFTRLATLVLDELERFPLADHITYGEAWIALVMLFLEDVNADIGVIEVGAGGRFDLTNIIDPELAIITSVGIDHTNTLGDTIGDIAWHKAGIIKPGHPALSAVRLPDARKPILEEASLTGAKLTEIDFGRDIEVITVTDRSTRWIERTDGREWSIGMAGRFQAQNGHTAIVASRILSELGWTIDDASRHQGLRSARIPGRAEIMPGIPRTMLDGAHNSQKVAALADDLPSLLPLRHAGRRIVVLGALEAKQVDGMVASLLPHMDVLIATSPQVLAKASRTAESIRTTALDAGFEGPIHVEQHPGAALELAHSLVRQGYDDSVLVTGSLYLVGNIRQHWYHVDDIIVQHTPWPVLRANEL